MVIGQEKRNLQEVRIARILRPVALQSAEIIGVAELRTQFFEYRPVAFPALGAERLREVAAQVGSDPIIINERVIDIEQEHDGCQLIHGTLPFGFHLI